MSLAKVLLSTPLLCLLVMAQQTERPNVVQQQLNRTFRTDIARNERGLDTLRDEMHELAAKDEIHRLAAEMALLRTAHEEPGSGNALSENTMWLLILSLVGERGFACYKKMK